MYVYLYKTMFFFEPDVRRSSNWSVSKGVNQLHLTSGNLSAETSQLRVTKPKLRC